MALKIKYHYRGHPRLIGFANDKYHDIYEAMADFVTLSNEEDGVAHVIERFIL